MIDFLKNLLITFVFLLFLYLVFRSVGGYKEGMTTDKDKEEDEEKPETNNHGGNASTYSTKLKSQIIKLQDKSLIHKYRPDYENVVMNLDDLTDHLMLQSAMSINPKDPQSSIDALNRIATLNNSKAGLNNIMKFIDGK
jgi:hypothetical protein